MAAVQTELAKKGAPLDPKKEAALVELMFKDRQTNPYTNNLNDPQPDLSGDIAFNPETVDAHVNEMEVRRDRVAAAAITENLLTPEQAEAFRTASRTQAESTRAALKMAASLMNGLQKSGAAEAK